MRAEAVCQTEDISAFDVESRDFVDPSVDDGDVLLTLYMPHGAGDDATRIMLSLALPFAVGFSAEVAITDLQTSRG